MYLYLLTNTTNGKQYVGITSRPVKQRLLEHFQAAQYRQTLIARALKKYGREAFTMKVIGEATDWAALCVLEQEAIVGYNTFKPHGYNLTHGGEGTLGYVHTEDARLLMSQANVGRVHDQAFRDKVSARMRGVPKSAEQRAKMGASQTGEKNHRYGKSPTPEHHEKMLAAANRSMAEHGHPMQGKTFSPEHKAKLSLAGKGRKQSPEHIEQRRQAILGHEVSEETRAKLRTRAMVQFATQGNPMQGKKHTEEAKQRMAAARLGKPAWNKGLKTGPLSEEHRVKLSVAHKGLPAWNKGLEAESLQRREHESLKAFKRRKARYMDE